MEGDNIICGNIEVHWFYVGKGNELLFVWVFCLTVCFYKKSEKKNHEYGQISRILEYMVLNFFQTFNS